ncbi:MAG TPA: hypothetical protein ENG35_04530 [Desulfobacteraceae bacterium]|nr:hypothetical protein [Desulfobacteraceae bacterium]
MRGLSVPPVILIFLIAGIVLGVISLIWAYGQIEKALYSECWKSVNEEIDALCLDEKFGCEPQSSAITLKSCVSDVIFVNNDEVNKVINFFNGGNTPSNCNGAEAYVLLIPRKPGWLSAWWSVLSGKERLEKFKQRYFSKSKCKKAKHTFNNINDYLHLEGPQKQGETRTYCIYIDRLSVNDQNRQVFEIRTKEVKSKSDC